MSILELIDELLLRCAKRVARWVYLVCGITNFGIARFCSMTAVMSRVFSLACTIRAGELTAFIAFLEIVMILCCSRSYFIANDAEKMYVHGFANEGRVTYKFRRKIWIFLSFPFVLHLFLYLVFFIVDISGMTYQRMSHFFAIVSIVLAFIVAPYFYSIEPEPPSESKLKKLIGAVKGFFSSSAIPQPA